MAGSAPGERRGGRAAGTPNKSTMATRARIETDADPVGLLIRIANGDAVEAADPIAGGEAVLQTPTLQQRMSAADTLRRIIVPECRERPITFSVGVVNTAADAMAALGRVIQAMGAGEITPGEAKAVGDVLALFQKAVEIADLEARIKALEAANAR